MKWSDLDLTAGIWVLQRTKSGAVVSRPLNIEVIMLLKRQDTSTEWVFPGRKGPRKSLFDAWEVVRKRAELVDAHIHDLRRTFGLMATRNSGLQVAQRLLGHSRISTTERVYAPLDTEDLRATVDLIGKATGKVKTTDRPTSEIKPGLN
jgi:integrase